MQVFQTSRFLEELDEILIFIAKDNLTAALNFQNELEQTLESLTVLPYRFRQSIKSANPQVHDLIFKGYVVPYRVNENLSRIEVIGIFGVNEWSL